MPPDHRQQHHWQQHNITFVDRETAQRAIGDRVAPTLLAAEADRSSSAGGS